MGNYYHAIRNTIEPSLKILDGIMSSGIKSISSGNLQSNEVGRMNYDDEICLCRPVRNMSVRNTIFYNLVYSGRMILIIDGSIEGVYKPQVLSFESAHQLEAKGFRGFTEFEDEYRTKEDIPVSKITGLLFPARMLVICNSVYNYNMYSLFDNRLPINSRKERIVGTIEYYERVVEILKNHNKMIPIYDSETIKRIEGPKDIEKVKIFR